MPGRKSARSFIELEVISTIRATKLDKTEQNILGYCTKAPISLRIWKAADQQIFRPDMSFSPRERAGPLVWVVW